MSAFTTDLRIKLTIIILEFAAVIEQINKTKYLGLTLDTKMCCLCFCYGYVSMFQIEL